MSMFHQVIILAAKRAWQTKWCSKNTRAVRHHSCREVWRHLKIWICHLFCLPTIRNFPNVPPFKKKNMKHHVLGVSDEKSHGTFLPGPMDFLGVFRGAISWWCRFIRTRESDLGICNLQVYCWATESPGWIWLVDVWDVKIVRITRFVGKEYVIINQGDIYVIE